MFIKRIFAAISTGFLVALAVPMVASAASTVVVMPAHTQGWYPADVRGGGQINYVSDATSPYPDGALQLVTDSNNASKAQYLKNVNNVPLSSVSELSYYTKQVSGPAVADASYQVVADLNGSAAGGYATLVYEPYWNGAVTPGTWQQWDVSQGLFWSSATVSCSNGTITRAPGGPATYTLADIEAACPDAVVSAFGVNVGTYNPNYNVEVDGVNFNGTVYNFELTNVPESKDACKNNGYQNLTTSSGAAFKNQGDCVSYVASGR